jgi:multidrug efflux pump
MNLSEISVNKPVFATVMSILLVIFGVVGFMQLGIREYPAVDPPIITVNTTYRGANAEVMQAQITEPLEDAINGIEGIRTVSSISTEQSSLITVEFNLEVDMETAANDVRDKVSKTISFLPKDVDPPIVEKVSADANAIILMTIRSDTRNVLELSDLADRVIKQRLQTIDGVGGIKIFGEKKYAMRLWLDPYKMIGKGITAIDIQKALIRENVELPSGRLEGTQTELSVRTTGLLVTDEQFNDLIIKQDEGNLIRLRDIGYASLGPENERTTLKIDQKASIIVGVLPQHGANNIAIVNEFYKRLEQLKKEIPQDYKLDVGYDFTKFERKAVEEVKESIIVALLLVVVIIFLFLRSWRSTIIPVVAIPVSMIATFAIMSLLGLSVNVLTLLGMVIAIGLVCDDAIVVLENIHTKIDSGLHRKEAAIKGMKEIFFAVISTTITLAAVFLPLMFLQGLTGRLFREFAIVVAGSVLISAFVAITLSPMMCSRILKHQRHFNLNLVYRLTEPFFLSLNRGYRYSLQAFIEKRWLVFPILGIIAILIFYFGSKIHSELSPLEDRSNIRIPTLAPEGASYEWTEKYLDDIDKYVGDSIPENSSSFYMIAPSLGTVDATNKGMYLIYLKDPDQRKRKQKEIFRKMTRDLTNITGIRTFPFEPPTIGNRMAGLPVQYVLQAPSLKSLQEALPKFLDEARKCKSLQFVDADLKVNKPELHVIIDRDKAALLGVSTTDVAQTLQLSLSGSRYCYFIMNDKQYEVIGQVMRYDRSQPDALKIMYVRNNKGELISLDNLIKFEEKISPASVFSFNGYVSSTISAGVAPGYTLGDCIRDLDEVSKKALPAAITTSLAGQSRDFSESASSLYFIFLLSVVLIFLILAAQFESFKDPLIILFTVPLALGGGLFTLWYFNQTLNVFSEIGLIMLIGLVTKNGILIVEFANQRKRAGMNKTEAVQYAAISRLRPILMTSSAMILGILPIALSLGASSESRQSLGIAVVGGLIFSTFLTLYIIPALYSYLSRDLKDSID